MNTDRSILKISSKIALAGLGILFLLSIFFYKERVLFADASFIIFNIINSGEFAIQFNRFGSFFAQVFPYVGTKIHLPINTIIAGYGIGFYLLYFSVLAVLVYRYKQYSLSVLMGLYYFLFFSESFIWISEIPQGIAWMFLLFGMTLHTGSKKPNIILFSIAFLFLAFLSLVTHFVIIIPVVYLWIYLIIEKDNWPFPKKTSIFFSCLLFGIIAFKFIFALSQNTGDTPLLHNVTHFSLQDIIDCFSTPVITMFLTRWLTNYWWSIIVFILGLGSLIRDNKKVLAAWTVIFVVGYFIVVGLTYGGLDEHLYLFHIESEWTCIGIIVATPFVFSFLPKLKPVTGAWLLTAIFITRLIYIYSFIPAFQIRNEYKEQILTQMRKKSIKKLALYATDDTRLRCRLDWAIPYESILMSAIHGDQQLLTFCFIAKDNTFAIEMLKKPKGFWNTYGMTSPYDLNYKYYNIDTTQPYQVMAIEELFK